ncbi:MAG: glycosyltransferase family 2 protein [Patescibacteria group bacterium]
MEKNNLKATILILTIGRDSELKNLIKDLEKQSYNNFSVVIVYQNEDKNIDNFISKKSLFKIIYTHKQQFTKLLNQTIKNLSTDIIIRIDDDVRIYNINFIHNHIENYKDKNIGAIQGNVLNPNEKPNNSFKTGKFNKTLKIQTHTNYNSTIKQYIECLYGCNFSFRKSVFNTIGGFDENIIGNNYFEETDFGFRILKNNYKIIFDPKSFLVHLRAPSGGARIPDKKLWFYYYSHNYAILLKNNFNKLSLVEGVFVIFSISILRSIMNKELFMYSGLSGYLGGLNKKNI